MFLALMLYPIGRSICELYRADNDARGVYFDGALSTSQLISIPLFLIGLIGYLRAARRPATASPLTTRSIRRPQGPVELDDLQWRPEQREELEAGPVAAVAGDGRLRRQPDERKVGRDGADLLPELHRLLRPEPQVDEAEVVAATLELRPALLERHRVDLDVLEVQSRVSDTVADVDLVRGDQTAHRELRRERDDGLVSAIDRPQLEQVGARNEVIRAGIDEAGYGPVLGPLVVALSAFDCTRDDPSLWVALRGAVRKTVPGRSARLPVADSKELYQGGKGLACLETTALAFSCLASGDEPSPRRRGVRRAALRVLAADRRLPVVSGRAPLGVPAPRRGPWRGPPRRRPTAGELRAGRGAAGDDRRTTPAGASVQRALRASRVQGEGAVRPERRPHRGVAPRLGRTARRALRSSRRAQAVRLR